jgi:hypothetical protein
MGQFPVDNKHGRVQHYTLHYHVHHNAVRRLDFTLALTSHFPPHICLFFLLRINLCLKLWECYTAAHNNVIDCCSIYFSQWLKSTKRFGIFWTDFSDTSSSLIRENIIILRSTFPTLIVEAVIYSEPRLLTHKATRCRSRRKAIYREWSKCLCSPDGCNTHLSCLTTWHNLTAWQPTARARGTLDSH